MFFSLSLPFITTSCTSPLSTPSIRPNSIRVAPLVFSFGSSLPPSSCVLDSVVSCLTRSSLLKVVHPHLSPSFVALVKSPLAPTSTPLALSYFLSRGGAGLRALCVCFACVSMSNDSIPHWPMHNDFCVLMWWLCTLPSPELAVSAEI